MSRVAERVDQRMPVPAWAVLAAVAGVAIVLVLGNLGYEVRELGFQPGPFVAAGLGLLLTAGVGYASDRLRRSDFDPVEAWSVTLSSLSIGLLVEFGYGLTLLVRIVENRPVAEAVLPLVVMGSIGLLAGAVVGWERVERRRVTAAARESRDAMMFTNSLLRHDVRNALQVVHGRAELLATHEDESVRDAAGVVRAQAVSIDQLIAEVESVNDVLTGDPDGDVVDLTVILADVVETADEGYPSAAVELTAPDELRVAGAEALYAVFRNLVENAVEHAGDGPVLVAVTAERDGTRVRVTVADDGRGVPESMRERIFERDVSESDGGHGLYVTRTIVDRLDGEVWVTDSDLGGAAFVVELPAADRNTEVAHAAVAE